MQAKKYKTVEEYFKDITVSTTKEQLKKLRMLIKSAAPQATEEISYNMPAFRWNGPLVYYAAYKNHIGFYPTSSPIRVFKEELAPYKTSKGAIQFLIDKKLPATLIKKIVKLRLLENNEKLLAKKKHLKRK